MKLNNIINENIINENINNNSYLLKSYNSFKRIIDDDFFTLEKISERTDNKKEYYYLKVFNSKTSPEILSAISNRADKISVLLKLNGQILSDDLKKKGNDRLINSYNSEYNDRIFNDQRYIKNAKSYIDEISILLPNNKQMIQTILKLLTNINNIPVFIYTNKKDFLSNNRNKAYKEPEIISPEDLLFSE